MNLKNYVPKNFKCKVFYVRNMCIFPIFSYLKKIFFRRKPKLSINPLLGCGNTLPDRNEGETRKNFKTVVSS